MIAASWPRPQRAPARLLTLDRRSGALGDHSVRDLPAILRPGDVVVVNDAATLPASLHGHAIGIGPLELRLLENSGGAWRAVVFGPGNWRTPTERRRPPPLLPVGARLSFGALTARVEGSTPESPRLLSVRFEQTEEAFWSGLYATGRPVQYSYMSGPLELRHVQNVYAARPWAAEAPSAGFVLNGELLALLARRGVRLAPLTHAAGLSATGDPALDAALPLAERFEIPALSVERIANARAGGGRVVAIGTSVVRALESQACSGAGTLQPGAGHTELRIGPGFRPRVVDGLLSGLHDPSASHYALLQAFAARPCLERAHQHAEASGYLEHEFGDVCLLL